MPLSRVHAGPAEVVPQAQRVADLVHDDRLQRLRDERVGLGAPGLDLAALDQQVEPELQGEGPWCAGPRQ